MSRFVRTAVSMQISTAGLQIHIIDDAQAGIMLLLDMVVLLLLFPYACSSIETYICDVLEVKELVPALICYARYAIPDILWLQTSFLDAFFPAAKSAFSQFEW